ncbi:hypothetical protein ABIA39_006405 [Nocardia sp. GAS34]|uniref:hypothetical protein n=1 Tax=unclassified Nocardia TaxID=2637762 RepID=UPI003D21BBA6
MDWDLFSAADRRHDVQIQDADMNSAANPGSVWKSGDTPESTAHRPGGSGPAV